MSILIDYIEINEKSTVVFTCVLKDEDGVLVVPTSFKWHLTDLDGTVVNGLEDQAETPASTIEVVLTGDDLALGGTPKGYKRKFSIQALYNSSLGSGLSINEEVEFDIENITKLT